MTKRGCLWISGTVANIINFRMLGLPEGLKKKKKVMQWASLSDH